MTDSPAIKDPVADAIVQMRAAVRRVIETEAAHDRAKEALDAASHARQDAEGSLRAAEGWFKQTLFAQENQKQ